MGDVYYGVKMGCGDRTPKENPGWGEKWSQVLRREWGCLMLPLGLFAACNVSPSCSRNRAFCNSWQSIHKPCGTCRAISNARNRWSSDIFCPPSDCHWWNKGLPEPWALAAHKHVRALGQAGSPSAMGHPAPPALKTLCRFHFPA